MSSPCLNTVLESGTVLKSSLFNVVRRITGRDRQAGTQGPGAYRVSVVRVPRADDRFCALILPKVYGPFHVSFVPHADAFGEDDQGTVGFKNHIHQDQRLITRMNH